MTDIDEMGPIDWVLLEFEGAATGLLGQDDVDAAGAALEETEAADAG